MPVSGFTIRTVALPGEGRGDYLAADPVARRLYVTHTSQLHILDLDSLRPLAVIGNLKAAHGVAIDAPSGHGFITDGNQDAVVMFDLSNARSLKVIPVGKKPDSILRDAVSGKIMVFDRDSNQVSVIAPGAGAVIGTIKLPNGPESAQGDDLGKVWVNLDEGNAIAEIDTRTMTLVRTIALTGCEGPAPIAFDSARRILFSGCGNHVMTATDADSGTVLARIPVGDDPDGIVFDAARRRILVGNRGGTWTVVAQRSRSNYVVERPLTVEPYAKTMVLDPRTHRVFSSTATLVWPAPVPGKKHLPNAVPGSFHLLVVSEK
ncbi:MAG: YncE family protein [Croceibacterium sp.]